MSCVSHCEWCEHPTEILRETIGCFYTLWTRFLNLLDYVNTRQHNSKRCRALLVAVFKFSREPNVHEHIVYFKQQTLTVSHMLTFSW